ncbi:hydrogenase maturation protease [Thiobacillus sp.]|uniref:hydrogenase maturation protease n=1 Tax=Thiobacillus sp. TaxID=924 RepID=UPI0025F75F56|nr:hydrogenase maturation protease [Thiobacillus sp.]
MSGVRILGIGSPSGDDQAGWLVVDALLAGGMRAGKALVIEKLDRPGAGLIGLLEGAERVVLVDAMQGNGQPGRLARFDQEDWPRYSHGLSSHGFGVLAALTLACELDGLPSRLELYGIEIAAAHPGAVPGPEIQAAARQLAAVIAASLG